jgi:hypothetical protein
MRVAGSTGSGIFEETTLATIIFRCDALGTSITGLTVDLLGDANLGNPQKFSPPVISGSVVCIDALPTDTPVPPTDTPVPDQPTDTPMPSVATDTPVLEVPTNTPVPGQPPETAVLGAVLPTATEARDVTPTMEPTPTEEVVAVDEPIPSPISEVGSIVVPPAAAVRPETTSAVMRFGDVSTDTRVIATNVVLAIILLVILLGASALFNDTIDQNRDELERRMDWFMTPFHLIGAGINWVADTIRIPERLQIIMAPIGILLVTGLVYSFNEPVGFNESGLLLFLSLILSLGVLTYIFEGGIAIISRDRFRVPSGVKIFPLAIVIAVVFVFVSRVVNFEAPIMFGFVAVATALAVTRLDNDQEAASIAVPASLLLIAALAAWALLGPLRDAADDSTSWYASLPSETAALIFAGGIEGILFAMIPVQFSDGYPLWRSLRWVWFVLAGVSAFVFSWVLLNPAAKEFDALIEGRVLTAIGLVSAYAIGVVLIWGYFALRSRGAGPAQPALAD